MSEIRNSYRKRPENGPCKPLKSMKKYKTFTKSLVLLNTFMEYKKKPTFAQIQINCRQKYDSKITDNFLKEQGLNPNTFAVMDIKVVEAKRVASELLKSYSKYLTKEQIQAINKFNRKVVNKKKCGQLKPAMAYPILNLAAKIKRQAHKDKVLSRQKIQENRYNQP